ncbi:MAG: hypothetical protein O3B24_01865 [Verrucomicrobia bacterium]|nr:hypothetical protein [Verrucomicrobiota bacterium]
MKARKLKRVKFCLPVLRGKQIRVAGWFNKWSPDAAPLRWSARTATCYTHVMLPAGRREYRFVIDDHWCIDPHCPKWTANPVGSLNSLLQVRPYA